MVTCSARLASSFGPALVGALVDATGSYDLGFFLLAGFLAVTALALAPLWRGRVQHTLPATSLPSTTKTES